MSLFSIIFILKDQGTVIRKTGFEEDKIDAVLGRQKQRMDARKAPRRVHYTHKPVTEPNSKSNSKKGIAVFSMIRLVQVKK